MYYITKKMIVSPCISICKTDPVTGYCYGCGRSDEEKKIWKNEDTSNEWKDTNLKDIKNASVKIAIESVEKLIKNSMDKIKLDKIYSSSIEETKLALKKKSS